MSSTPVDIPQLNVLRGLHALSCQQSSDDDMQGRFTYTTGVGLHVDPPFGGVKVEGLEGALLAEDLELVDVLVAAVVPRIREALRVLVGEDGAVGLHRRPTRQVLQKDKLVHARQDGTEH